MSSPAIQFKGSGLYITDYARKGSSDSDASGRRTRRSRRESKESSGVERVEAVERIEVDESSEPAPRATAEHQIDQRIVQRQLLDHVIVTVDIVLVDRIQLEIGRASRRSVRPDRARQRLQVGAEGLGEIRALQGEVHHRLEEAELVAGVVADAVDLVGVERPRAQQLAQAVGQLDLAGPVAAGRRRAWRRCPASGCSGR